MSDPQLPRGGNAPARARLDLVEMRAAVDRGMADGAIQSPTAIEIKSYLHQMGIACTPALARRLRNEIVSPPTADASTLGGRLKSARETAKLNRRELGARVGRSESYISYLESGKRRPSDETLSALAAALSVEAEWLDRGADSIVTRRIADVLGFAQYAAEHADWVEADRLLGQLLDEDPGRPLRRDEKDEALYLRARCLTRFNRPREAEAALDPVFRRCLAGESALPVLDVALRYMTALMQPPATAKGLADAVLVGQKALAAALERDDAWWRTAATVIGAQTNLGLVTLAVAQGEAWLAELDRSAVTKDRPFAAAALIWNLADAAVHLGHLDDALEKITQAKAMYLGTGYEWDDARVIMEWARILVLARPHQFEEAIRALDGCRAALERVGSDADAREWVRERARAELAAGRLLEVEKRLQSLVDEHNPHQVKDTVTVEAWTLIGDARASGGRVEAATSAYAAAGDLLRGLAQSRVTARHWRDLGDRIDRLGNDPSAVAAAYRQALDADDLPTRPGLLPHWQLGAPEADPEPRLVPVSQRSEATDQKR